MRWWWDSLLCCLPLPMRRWIVNRRLQVIVEVVGDVASVWVERGPQRTNIGGFQRDGEGFTPALARAIPPKKHRIVLRLDYSQVLVRQTSLPLGVEENLGQVLGFEMDRLSPFSSENAYFDAHVIERNAQSGRLGVELALAPRQAVDPWLQDLVARGLQPTVVDAEGLWSGANLLPAEQRWRRSVRLRVVDGVLAVTLVCALAAVLLIPLWQKRVIAENLAAQVAKLNPVAGKVTELRENMEKAKGLSGRLVEQRRKNVFAVDLLAEITRLVPDNTWVQQYEYRGGEIQLRGESDDAAGLIKRFEGSGLFKEISFRSPVVRQTDSGKERFHLAARVVIPEARK
jgi:general secretion pathway protein L